MTIFRHAGFDVAMWDNQKSENSVLFSDFSNNSLFYNKKMVSSTYHHLNKGPFDYDQQLVDTALTVKRNPGSTFTVFHLMGQHTLPLWRYPENDKNAVFTADSIQRADLNEYQRQYIAEYDNATRYNDYVIGNIIQYYSQRNAVILYLSDHGDEVYDYRDVVGRTHEPVKQKQALKYQYEIPMVLWCSDQFMDTHPAIMENIRKAVLRPFSSDNVPQLLMGLSGIRSSFYEPEKDVLSNQYECGIRTVQNTTDYDAVMNK
jgi:heptose-I-phosphate ethanolaminephosphotransferase